MLAIDMLGPLEVRLGDRVIDLPRGRLRALTVALALSAGQPVPVETLAERVWGDRPPVDARASLHTAVMRLRRLLGTETIGSGGGSYTLAIDPDQVDVRRFERLLDRADQTDDPDDELRLRQVALLLWRSEPFEQHLSDWLSSDERPRLVERYLTATERAIDLQLAGRPAGDLVGELRTLTARYPLRESLWVRLLRALAATGRTAEALTSYHTIQARLADELGVDPASDLRRTQAELLAATEPPGPAPRQLPADIAAFTGRAPALAKLDKLTTGPDPLVVVHGPGGIGKTALVVHWAHRAHYPGGHLFVDLRGFGPTAPVEPAAALVTLLGGLGVPSERIPDDPAARGALLRTTLTGRRVLVVLDNAQDADQVRPLLPGGGATVLVTSRNELRGLAARERARGIALDVLPAEEAVALLGDRIEDRDGTALTRLAELCGHLPLALTVAAERATRYPDSPLDDLIRQLEHEHDRLDLLETGEDLSTNLRAVMSWSYRALCTDAARLFRLLGLHPGTEFSAPAAATLAGLAVPAANRLLDRLTETHLLGSLQPGRYTMHDLVQVYAAERAGEDPAEQRSAAVRRLHRWYAGSATAASVAVWGHQAGEPVTGALTFDGDRPAMRWFEAELHTLLAVLVEAARSGLDDVVIHLVRALAVYQDLSRRPIEIRPPLELALAAAEAVGDQAAEAHLLILLGRHHEKRAEFESALRCFESAHTLHDQLDDPTGVCAALGNIGIVHWRRGCHAEAIGCLERSIDHARRHDLPERAAAALHTLAAVHRDDDRLGAAESAAAEAVQLWRMAGLPLRESIALDTLGSILLARGDHTRATSCYAQAIRTFTDTDSTWWLAYTLRNLGRAHQHAGDPPAARASWLQALNLLDTLGAEDNPELSRAELRACLSELSGQP